MLHGSQLEQLYRMPSCLNSATHHMGLDVSTNTVSSSGTRWFDVDINPSNPEVALAKNSGEEFCITLLI